MIELYINGILADLLPQDYTYTLQVNDLFSFDTREFSHSGMFYLPTTPNNRKIFGFADEVASDNAGAYKKYSVDYYVNGIAITLEANGFLMGKRQEAFLFHFQENSKDIYQFLANRTLQGLPLEELTHNKTASVIKHQHENDLDNLLYAVAHYGGKTQEGDRFNFDYVPASIRMDWIRKMIEQKSGQKIEGNFFASQAWQRLYMTTSEVQKVSQENYYEVIFERKKNGVNTDGSWDYTHYRGYMTNSDNFFDMARNPNAQAYIVPEDNEYLISLEITETKTTNLLQNWRGKTLWFGLDINGQQHTEAYFDDHWVKEGNTHDDKTISVTKKLKQGDRIRLVMVKEQGYDKAIFSAWVNFSVKKRKANTIEIKDYIAEFSLLDWFKEVLNFFSLTSIKDQNGQRFYTLDERLQAPAVDWSEKFVRIVEEKYHDTSSYGQINNYLYSKYDPQKTGQRGNDYRMLLQDEALPIRKEYQSKFFGALDNKTHLLGQEMETFGFWEEQAKEDNKGQIKIEYKEKNNRYHLFEAVQKTQPLAFVSGEESGALSSCYVADFAPMKWENLHRNYYQNLPKLVGNLHFLTCEFSLNEVDIHQFSFFSRIYVEALGAYFLPNKITYKVGSLAVVEMVKIRQ